MTYSLVSFLLAVNEDNDPNSGQCRSSEGQLRSGRHCVWSTKDNGKEDGIDDTDIRQLAELGGVRVATLLAWPWTASRPHIVDAGLPLANYLLNKTSLRSFPYSKSQFPRWYG